MHDPQAELTHLEPEHEFLIAIDSDGCAFDTMEIKHKECFIPNIIRCWDLHPVAKYVREAAEFVNLYSRWRGINRFPAVVMVFDLLKEWPEVQQRNPVIPQVDALRQWIQKETKLSNAALEKHVAATGDEILAQALAWSEAVNRSVGEIVRGVPPFPHVRESLESISRWADIVVCSATPVEALKREWDEHDLSRFARVIAGQEMGSKREHIQLAAEGRYARDKVLMVGDALGDLEAARSNEARFYSINPGGEERSWERFLNEAADRFRNGTYQGEYEDRLIAEFESILPSIPPWKSD
ncbi:MAG: HAD hydrolase-like protein [Fidelibacterota bacterium]|nr:MAG: HAD hydrolase-like protein [Candidatus Neomarinimicrobiota bacterium]